MTDKKDAPKGPDRGAADAGAKRPYATIDLKAVEVREPEVKAPAPAWPKGSAQAEAAAKVAAAAKAAPASGAGTSEAKAETKAEAKPSSVPPVGAKPAESAAAAATAKSAAATALPPRQGGGVGRFLTHMAAGIVGGGLALIGGEHLAPLLGLDAARPSVVTGLAPDHAARLNNLEKQMRERLAVPAGGSGDPAKVAAIDAGLARIDELSRQVGTLNEALGKAGAENALIREEMAKQAAFAGAGERLVKLEEQLSAMTRAAEADPQRAGRLPQLAQLTGQLADLKAALDTRLAAQRKDMLAEIDQRSAATAAAAEAAKAGAQRIDKDLVALRSDATRLGGRLDELRTGSDKLDQALKSVQDDASALKASIEALKGDLAGQMRSTAKPADVAMAIAPISAKIATLEQSVAGVVKAEDDRRSNTERIVLSLELGNLKRAMERGQKYSAELAEVRKVAGSRVDLAPLERFQSEGVPTIADLTRSFRPIANAIVDAGEEQPEAGVVDRLLSGAKTIVRVRKTSHAPSDTSVEAVVARMEAALKDQRLGDLLEEARKLPANAAKPAQDWLRKVEARQTVEAAIAQIDVQLKSSLGAGPAPQPAAAPAQAQPAPKGTK